MPECQDKLLKEYFSGFKYYGTNLHVRLISLSHYSELPTLEQPSLCLYILFPNTMRTKFLSKTKNFGQNLEDFNPWIYTAIHIELTNNLKRRKEIKPPQT